MLSRRLALAIATVLAVVTLLLLPTDRGRVAASPAPVPAATPAIEAQAQQPAARHRVGIKPLDPFVLRSDGNVYQGFSIELWDEIVRRNNWSTEYVWYDTLPPLLDDVAASKLDVGIAGISITREREGRMDFSHPMFNAGLQILAPARGEEGWLSRLEHLVSPSVFIYLGALIAIIFIAGNVMWLFDRQHRYGAGLSRGMFRAAAVGLVGEVGEQERPLHQFIAVVWVILGISFVSAFTASLTTELTVQQITGGITGVNDLDGKNVVTVSSSTAANFLADRRIEFTGVPSIDEAFALIDNGKADALVFDAPVLQNHLQRTGSNQLALIGSVFQREDYGIALPTDSRLRETINATLLQLRADGTYDRIYEHYFGRTQ